VPMVVNLNESAVGNYAFQASVKASGQSGRHGYTVRVIPCHPDLTSPFLPGMIVWA
jgi:hypothetical protein